MIPRNRSHSLNYSETLLYKDEVFAFIGAAIEVHRQLGSGFLESVYEEALTIELGVRQIPFVSQPKLNIYYKENPLTRVCIPDLMIYETIVVELKAVDQLTNREVAQVLHYLKATKLRLGLLVNFGKEKLDWQRIIL